MAHSTATMNASIIRDTVDSSLEIVYMLRTYQFLSDSTTMALDEDYMGPLDDTLNILRLEEASVYEASIAEGKLGNSLRDVNMSYRSRFSSMMMETSKSTKALTIARSYPEDQEAKWTLINMLNMLSWYKFDPAMKASTSTSAPTIAPSTSLEDWRLTREVMHLFNKALHNTFPEFEETWKMNWYKEDGDFQCDNVLSIWPKIKRGNITKYKKIVRPREIGDRIKRGLRNLNSEMIEGVPEVHGVGFVNIKLSGNWIAKNIHKMLRCGIDTWAPRQQLDFKSTVINCPTWNASNLMPMDVLRRQLIIMSRMHMLHYVKCAATTSSGNGMSLPSGELDKHFEVVEKDGEMLIYPKGEGSTNPLVRGKIRNGKSLGERDTSFGYPLEDLGALWHGFINEKEDWIVCVTPTQQQDYIENCFNAAQHAGWTTTHSIWPLATFVGFKTCSTSMEDVLSFLYKAEYPCEAGEAARVLGYSDEAVLDCAITYTILKYHRLADCKFSFNEMLDVEGDTFVRLLRTRAQICKITNRFREEINELKKASNLGVDVIWSQGVERELGFHLLMFTEVIKESYMGFFPHLLCKYLGDLSTKFSNFYRTYMSSGLQEKARLLLCEASAVVMDKGFHLLGISQNPPLKAVSVAFALNYVTPSSGNPPKDVNIRTRFEVFTTYLHVTNPFFKNGELFGSIQVSDYYGLVPEGWGKILNPGPGRVCLWDRNTRESVDMTNSGRLEIDDPIFRHSVPVSSSMEIVTLLYATSKKNKDFFELCNQRSLLNFSSFLESDSESKCGCIVARGDDGHIRMYYILLKDAVDSHIKVKLGGVCGRRLCGRILAYYDNFDYGEEDDLVKSLYKASLFESYGSSDAFKDGDLPLTRSLLAVPSSGYLVVDAKFFDLDSGHVILNDKCVFEANSSGSFVQAMMCKGCSLAVEVTWSQGGSGTSEVIANQSHEANSAQNMKNPPHGWMIGFLFVVSFLGLFSVVPLRKIMSIDFKLIYQSGTATAHLINSFHTPQGAELAKKQVKTLGKFFSFSFLWGFFQWFFTGGDNCGFTSFPSLGLKAFENKFFLDFSTTYVSVGMICPYLINVSLLVGAILSWGVMWALISEKKGDWYPAYVSPSSLDGLQGYRVFIGISMILGDGLYNLIKVVGYTLFGLYRQFNESKIKGDVSITGNSLPADLPCLSYDEEKRARLFLKDQIPMWIAIVGYLTIAIVSAVTLPHIFHQLKWYYIAAIYVFAPALAFCNAYGCGLTDWSLASTYGMLAIFIGAWAGGSNGGVLAGLAACGVMMNLVSTASDLMQDFKTGYIMLASPRSSMFVSQVIGAAMGCVISPCVFCVFWLFYKAFGNLGVPGSEYPRNMAILGVEGFSALPDKCLMLCYVFFGFAIFVNGMRDAMGKNLARFIPIPMAMAIPFYIGGYFAIDMCVGSFILFIWSNINKEKAAAFGPAVASGFICGDGIWTLPSLILSLASSFFRGRLISDGVDTFLGS